MLSLLVSLLVTIPFCYAPAAFVTFLVKERVCKSKRVRVISQERASQVVISDCALGRRVQQDDGEHEGATRAMTVSPVCSSVRRFRYLARIMSLAFPRVASHARRLWYALRGSRLRLRSRCSFDFPSDILMFWLAWTNNGASFRVLLRQWESSLERWKVTAKVVTSL